LAPFPWNVGKNPDCGRPCQGGRNGFRHAPHPQPPFLAAFVEIGSILAQILVGSPGDGAITVIVFFRLSGEPAPEPPMSWPIRRSQGETSPEDGASKS
jgi:hypothetical protein